MNTICDSVTIELLRRIVGMRLEAVLARRYPGYLSYSQIIFKFDNNFSIQAELYEELVKPKFEVFVMQIRPSTSIVELNEWDRMDFGDFIVAEVSVLRREEWVKQPMKDSLKTVGQCGVEQSFGSLDDGDDAHDAIAVDSGLSFVSMRGAEIRIDADVFPLVFQLRYEVSSSPIPVGTKIAVNEYRNHQ